MLHEVLSQVLIFVLGFSCACAIGTASLLAVVGVVELAVRIEKYVRRQTSAICKRYPAERAIRDLKRSAIRQMLDVERDHRRAAHVSDVVEGTAVEIEPR